jgi:hypothetical protein
MSKKILTNYDFSKNEIQNAKIQNLASAPSSPASGQVYYDTTLFQFGVYNGSGWTYLGSGGGTVTSVSVAAANGFSGTVATSTTTPAITLTATPTGILKSNGTAISAATSGTDYAPATATTSSLKGNGSGGFSAATLNDNGTPTADFSMGSHKLTNVLDPTSAQDAATKNYVDTTAQGLDAKPSAVVVGTSNVSLSTLQTIDGVTLTAGQRVLLVGQTTASQNGLWLAASGSWTRPTDFATGSSQNGTFVFIESGTSGSGSGYVMTGASTVTVDTSSQTWVQFSGAGEVTAGTGLTKSGNTLSLTTPVTVGNGGFGTGTGITGLVKGSGSAYSAATSGTDYAPATSGSNILKGNGAGGFSSAKYTATIGDGSSTSIAVTDSLGTIDKVAVIRDATSGAQVDCDITYSSTQVTFGFTTAPASNAYKVVIIG